MNTEIRARTRPGEVAAVAVADGRLLDVAIERPGARDGVGDLHRGRITARVPAMAGAFVALAGGAEGFLPDSHGAAGCGEGDGVVVRVARAAQGGKGLRL
ncbi:MAG: ribonuclease E/G, partial [Acetobacteraceae bacterium]